MPEQKLTQEQVEESFRSALRDAVTMVEQLSKHCKTTEDFVAIASLALENDAQLRLLMSAAIATQKRP